MDGQRSEGGAAQNKNSCTPPGFLFVPPKQKKKEYWQCIKLVAPTMEYFCMVHSLQLQGEVEVG